MGYNKTGQMLKSRKGFGFNSNFEINPVMGWNTLNLVIQISLQWLENESKMKIYDHIALSQQKLELTTEVHIYHKSSMTSYGPPLGVWQEEPHD